MSWHLNDRAHELLFYLKVICTCTIAFVHLFPKNRSVFNVSVVLQRDCITYDASHILSLRSRRSCLDIYIYTAYNIFVKRVYKRWNTPASLCITVLNAFRRPPISANAIEYSAHTCSSMGTLKLSPSSRPLFLPGSLLLFPRPLLLYLGLPLPSSYARLWNT